jgi:hypothetical protein
MPKFLVECTFELYGSFEVEAEDLHAAEMRVDRLSTSGLLQMCDMGPTLYPSEISTTDYVVYEQEIDDHRWVDNGGAQ